MCDDREGQVRINLLSKLTSNSGLLSEEVS